MSIPPSVDAFPDDDAFDEDLDDAEIRALREKINDAKKSRKEEQRAALKRKLEEELRSLEVGSAPRNPSSIVNDPRPAGQVLDPIQEELQSLRIAVKLLQSDKAHLEKRSNPDPVAPAPRTSITSQSAIRAWNGELDYAHEGLPDFAKAAHKRYKDLRLPPGFTLNTPPGKNFPELQDAKLMWTNYCTLLRILQSKEEFSDEDFDMLGVVLNLCTLLVQRRDQAMVAHNTDPETSKAFKQMVHTGPMMLSRNQELLNQAVSFVEARGRTAAANAFAPRQRPQQSQHQQQQNQQHFNRRGGRPHNNNFNNNRRGNQIQSAINNSANQAPPSTGLDN